MGLLYFTAMCGHVCSTLKNPVEILGRITFMTKFRWNDSPREPDPARFVKDPNVFWIKTPEKAAFIRSSKIFKICIEARESYIRSLNQNLVLKNQLNRIKKLPDTVRNRKKIALLAFNIDESDKRLNINRDIYESAYKEVSENKDW